VAPGCTLPSTIRPGDRLDPNDETERNRYMIFQEPNGWRITGIISLRQSTGTLGGDLGRPMIDKTGLQGYYDRLHLEPANPGGVDAPRPAGPVRGRVYP